MQYKYIDIFKLAESSVITARNISQGDEPTNQIEIKRSSQAKPAASTSQKDDSSANHTEEVSDVKQGTTNIRFLFISL